MDDSKLQFDIVGGNEITQCLFRMGRSNWPLCSDNLTSNCAQRGGDRGGTSPMF